MRYFKSIILVAAMFAPGSAYANLISNGTFSSACGSATFCTYTVGDNTNITDWTVINGGDPTVANGSVDLITGYWQAPPGGGNSVDLDGLTFGGLSQTFATVANQGYAVTFYLSGNPDGTPVTKTLRVSDGTTTQDYFYTLTGANTLANMGWVAQNFGFIATGASTTLSFASFNSFDDSAGTFGPVIGNVVVEAVNPNQQDVVPEPSVLALMAAGLLSLFGVQLLSRRRRAKA